MWNGANRWINNIRELKLHKGNNMALVLWNNNTFWPYRSPISKTYGKLGSFPGLLLHVLVVISKEAPQLWMCVLLAWGVFLVWTLTCSNPFVEVMAFLKDYKKESCNMTGSIYPIFPYPTSAWNASSQDSVKSHLYCPFLGLLCLYLLKSSVSSCLNAATSLKISLLTCSCATVQVLSCNTSDLFLKRFT